MVEQAWRHDNKALWSGRNVRFLVSKHNSTCMSFVAEFTTSHASWWLVAIMPFMCVTTSPGFRNRRARSLWFVESTTTPPSGELANVTPMWAPNGISVLASGVGRRPTHWATTHAVRMAHICKAFFTNYVVAPHQSDEILLLIVQAYGARLIMMAGCHSDLYFGLTPERKGVR